MDIFDFWSEIEDDAFVHPADQNVHSRVPHRFEPGCLPIAFTGPLREAPIVLLFLSPGYNEFDKVQALTTEGQSLYKRQREGRSNLPNIEEHPPAYSWWSRIVKQYDVEPMKVADKIAVLNIGAYHSSKFRDWHMLTALPSSRVSLDWAQTILFPEAETGNRIVVCHRSSRHWGLERGECYGEALFVPPCTPNGFMHHNTMRETVTAAVRAKLGYP